MTSSASRRGVWKELEATSFYHFARIIRNCVSHNFRIEYGKFDRTLLPGQGTRQSIRRVGFGRRTPDWVGPRCREQGIAANATPRSMRGQTKRGAKDVFYRTRRHARSYALQERIDAVKRELIATRSISDPARARLLETRKAVVDAWNTVASTLEAHGDVQLGDQVRYFVRHLPPVLTDRERLAVEMIQRARAKKPDRTREDDRIRDRTMERTR